MGPTAFDDTRQKAYDELQRGSGQRIQSLQLALEEARDDLAFMAAQRGALLRSLQTAVAIARKGRYPATEFVDVGKRLDEMDTLIAASIEAAKCNK